MLGFLSIMASTAVLLVNDDRQMTPAQLASANRAGLQAIRSFSVRLDHEDNMPGGPTAMPQKPLEPAYTYYWYKQADDERVRMIHLRANGDKFARAYDTYNGPRGFVELGNYNPERPPELSELQPGPAYGNLAERKRSKVWRHNPRLLLLLLMAFHRTAPAFEGSLEELVPLATRSEVVKEPAQSEWHCYELKLVFPDYIYHLCIDPHANFLVRRIAREPVDSAKTPEASVVEVETFTDCGSGVFFPKKIKRTMTHRKANFTAMGNTDVTIESINMPLKPDAFDIKFPAWLRVNDERTGTIKIWGDGEPRQTFTNKSEYEDWQASSHPGLGLASQSRNWIWATVAMIACLGTICWLRFRRRKPKRIPAA